jgi:hypothetical protein
MRNHRVTALAALLVVLASIFAVGCTDPSGRPASSPSTPRVDHDR